MFVFYDKLLKKIIEAPHLLFKKSLDLSSGTVALNPYKNIYKATVYEATAFTFDTSGLSSINSDVITFELHVNMKTVSTLTFPDSVSWTASPTMNDIKVYVLTFRSIDGGISWIGSLSYEKNEAFITRWNVEAEETVYLPLTASGTYDMFVDWGDGSSDAITNYANNTHTYADAGTYDITIYGTCSLWKFGDVVTSKDSITAVVNWGNTGITSMFQAFMGCTNLVEVAPCAPDATSYYMAFYATAIAELPELLFNNCVSTVNFDHCFQDGIFTSIPGSLFSKCTAATSFYSTFFNCLSLEAVPSGLFDSNALVTNFSNTFSGCVGLVTKPAGLFDNNTAVTTFAGCFNNCSSLTGSSDEYWLNPSGAGNYTLTAPDYDTGVPDGDNCYRSCANLSDYATIPTYWQ